MVNLAELKKCKLYPTSMLASEEKHNGGISLRTLCSYRDIKMKLQDQTPDEAELLAAIEETIKQHQPK